MENDTKLTNPTEILAAQFAQLDRIEIEVEGLPKLYARVMNFEQKVKLSEIHTMSDSKKKTRAMCGVIVRHVIDEDGNKAFLNYNNKPAAEVLATMCDSDTITDLFTQAAGVNVGDDDEIEEVSGKSQEPDSDS